MIVPQSAPDTVRDRVWLWGMKVNVLQESEIIYRIAMGRSTMTVEQAIRQTGVTDVILAGGLPLTRDSLGSIPSATRVLCKTGLHMSAGAGWYAVDYAACLPRLKAESTAQHVFVNCANTAWKDNHLLKHLRQCVKRAGINPQGVDLHSFRYTVASHMIRNGADVKTVQDFLGHQTIPMTLEIYAQVFPFGKRQALSFLPAAVRCDLGEILVKSRISTGEKETSLAVSAAIEAD